MSEETQHMNKGTPADPLREAFRERFPNPWQPGALDEAMFDVFKAGALATKPAEQPAVTEEQFRNLYAGVIREASVRVVGESGVGAVQPPAPEPVAWLVTRRTRRNDQKRATYLFQDLKSAQYEYEGWLEDEDADPKLISLYEGAPPSREQRGAALTPSVKISALVRALERSAANTDTDWRWLAANELRRCPVWEVAALALSPEPGSPE